jgi:RIO-like serine/threonine protein kinase
MEVKCYSMLKSLQGKSIPRLLQEEPRLGSCVALGGSSNRRVFAMILTLEGSEHTACSETQASSLSAEALLDARDILMTMHERGVAHGDVRRQNIVYDAVQKKSIVIDFSHSIIKGHQDFDRACQRDLMAIDELIERKSFSYAK